MKRAVVLAGPGLQAEAALGALAAAGFDAVAAGSAADVRAHVEIGAAVVVLGSGGPGLDAAQAAALASMPAVLRRSCVVVLVGQGFTTGDAARLGELAGAAVAAKRVLVAPLDPSAAGRLGG
ncbi:MAG: hypothetical protein B7Z68_08490 [Acidobacteria bacterium 21-70-11]|nr:MAG: hypothetical protein B7Z68_08490 [Acidobacteria bacterium 21-70-11]